MLSAWQSPLLGGYLFRHNYRKGLGRCLALQQEFMSGRRMNLMRFFLKSSPSARYDSFTQIFATGVSEKNPPPVFKSDEQYVYDFLNRLEVTGPSIAAIAAHRTQIASSNQRFVRIFPQPKAMRVPNGAYGEPEQLLESIRSAINMVEGGVTLYQQLQQRLQVASPDAIAAARNKLVTLFKLLLKRRETLPQGSIEHEAASSLSRTLLHALEKSQEGQEHYKLGELQAMEQLLVAREYQRKGLEDMAMNSLEEICRNQGASSKTRLEALRVLCSSGEEQGDATILESLVVAMGGQEQYEQMLLMSIRKIKDRVGG